MIPLKAAAFDLDDTLLRNDLSISFRTLETFRRMHDSGFIFVAASGRTMMSMKPFTDQLKCVSLCIACNGALIWDPNTNQVLHREVFPTELCKEIARFGNEYHCYAQTYSDDCFFFNEYSKYSERYAAASMLPGVRNSEKSLSSVSSCLPAVQPATSKQLISSMPTVLSALFFIVHTP